ncbi:Hypothetical protein NocV09_00400290 [Nannochloropsis oceanica]
MLAIDAVQAGLRDGLEQLEIEFPISPGRIDVSLGEFLDDSREWTREFVRPFTPKGSKLWVIFPDGKEATLANERWGGVNFRIMGIESAMKMPKEEVCELQVVVTPGFNVQEYINMEKIQRPGVPMVVVNGNLDRIRGGYYPRLFYPGLYNVKERMLKFFEPVFYLKPAQGGFIYRRYPEEWQQVLTYYDFRQQLRPVRRDGRTEEKKEVLRKVVETTRERPAYNDVVNALKKESARMGREAQEAQEEEERVEAAEREAKRQRLG